ALIRGVTNGPSPDWMQARLKAAGLQPKSLLVDVTNYISLDRARPLHVYDAAKLSGAVVARLGKAGEKLDALDGKTYPVTGGRWGRAWAVSAEAMDVLIALHWFDPLRTARTGRATWIHSDACYRLERDVAPQRCVYGVSLAIALSLGYRGGLVSKAKIAGSV